MTHHLPPLPCLHLMMDIHEKGSMAKRRKKSCFLEKNNSRFSQEHVVMAPICKIVSRSWLLIIGIFQYQELLRMS
ncbi:hypothetical protein MHYP_G00309060 [Metynnis hypsauchen]